MSSVDTLSANAQEFLDSSGVLVNNMTHVRGQLVCSNSSIRDELASVEVVLIETEMNGTFVDGSSQCGDCGKQ